MATTRWPLRLGLTGLFVGWFGLMLGLGVDGYFMKARGGFGFSAVQLAILLPQLLFGLAYGLLPALRHFIRTADLTFLVAVQVVRILACSHLVLWGYGLMAGGFALPVALGNLAVCVIALSSITAVAQRRGHWRARIYLLSFAGIAEFLMTIALSLLGFFTLALSFDPPMALGAYVTFKLPPLSLFPTFAIPSLMVIHLVTLLALKHQRPADSPVTQPS